jgi:hypothetical protein
MAEIKLNLDELLAKTPDMFKPIVAKYGPALAAMTAQEFCDWLELLILGNDSAAWQALLAKMDNPSLMDAWKDTAAKWADATNKNSARMEMQKAAVLATLKILLGIALAAIGF